MTSIYVEIGRRVKTLRLNAKLTQGELAGKANISLSFLGHIERGTRKLSVDTLISLSEALGCSINYLTNSSEYDNIRLPDMLERAAQRLRDLEELEKRVEGMQEAEP